MSNHARLSPSNHAWVHCPGSIRECAHYPDISGEAAIDGTGSHLLLEMCICENKKPEEFKGKTIGIGHEDKKTGWFIDTDRINRVNCALNYINRRKCELAEQFKGCTIGYEAESKSNPGQFCGRDDWHGTVDITMFVYSTELKRVIYVEVIDYKDGVVFVNVENNPQLIAYMSGKAFALGVQGKTRITIIQPKTKPIIRYQDIEYADLFQEFHTLVDATNKTDDPEAPLIPDHKGGKGWCRWCPHRENCTGLKNELKNKLKKVGDFMDLNNILNIKIEDMTNDQLSSLLDCEKQVIEVFKTAKSEAENRAKNGDQIPHYSILPGKGKNVWKEPEEIIFKILRGKKFKKNEIYIPKFISVSEVLKSDNLTDKQKKDIENKYVQYMPGKPTLKRCEESKKEADAMALMREAAEEVKFNKPKFSFI